jgi:hypothetical protein
MGLERCAIDTHMPGNYSIIYSVSDTRRARLVVNRTVVVTPPCPAGKQIAKATLFVPALFCDNPSRMLRLYYALPIRVLLV